MAEAGSLNIDLLLNSAKFQEGIAKASKAMSDFEKSVKPITRGLNKFGDQMEKIGSSMTTNLTLPIAAAGVAIGAAVNKMANYGSTINDMSVRTGFSRESLQELKFAADQTGVSMESIEQSTRKLTKAMGEAASGGKAAETFNQLGIAIKNADGSLRPANEVFNDTLDALNRIPDEATRNVIGMQLLGKSAGDLTPLVVAGKDGLNAFAKEARDAGLVMSEDAVIAADNFGDKMDKLKSQLGHAGMEIATALMPVIEKLIGFIETSVIPSIKKLADWFGGLSDSQKSWIIGVAAAVAALGPLLVMIGKISGIVSSLIGFMPKLAGAFTFLSGPIGVIIGVLAGLSAALLAVRNYAGSWSNVWKDLGDEVGNFADKVVATSKMLMGVLTNNNTLSLKGWEDYKKAQVDGLNLIINKQKRHAEQLKESRDEEARLAAEGAKSNEAILAQSNLLNSKLNPSLGNLKIKLDDNKKALSEIGETSKFVSLDLSQMGDQWWTVGTLIQSTTPIITTSAETISTSILDMGNVIKQSLETTLSSVGESIGAMVSGTGKIGGVLNSVMSGIADFVGNFGKAMIAASTAAMLAKSALATPASLAAGVALVGLSVVLKNVISKNPMGFADGGLVFGETMGIIGEGRGTTRSNPEVVAPLDKLQGFMNNDRGGIGGGTVVFEIHGERLRGVLNNTSKARRFTGNG